MNEETWEILTLDWKQPGDDGSFIRPEDLWTLLFSANRAEAEEAYFTVSETVGQNGWIYPCALPVVKCLLAALPNPNVTSRLDVLEVVAQIASAESAPDAPQVVDQCLIEIRNAYWYFIFGLQCEKIVLASKYIDILGCLGAKYSDLRGPVEEYLKFALTRNLPHYDVQLVHATIKAMWK